MSEYLENGQKVVLKVNDNISLSKIIIGFGWNSVVHNGNKDELFHTLKKIIFGIDCDAAVLLCQNGKVQAMGDVVSFLNIRHISGAVRHMGDNLTGANDEDDEQILVDLSKMPEKYDRLIFVVNIFGAKLKKHHFGMLSNIFIRIVDSNHRELCRYEMTDKCDNMTALIFGELYRCGNEWEFSAIGQATKDGDLNDVVKRYI